VIADTGRSMVELDELVELDGLSVVDDVEQGSESARVLLDIPMFDVSFAQSLGAKPGNRRMNLGVKVLLGPGNRIMASYVSKSETVAADPKTVDADASLVRGIDVLNEVTKGMYGGKKWRGFINWILGENRDRMPLAGNLVIGSTTGGGNRNAVMIPMLNPEVAKNVILNVREAVYVIDDRAKQIIKSNPLINHPAVRPADMRTQQVVSTNPLFTRRREVLPGIAADVAVRTIQSLPNADRIKDLVARSNQKDLAGLESVEIISLGDIEYQEINESARHSKSLRATSTAEAVINNPLVADDYLTRKRAQLEEKIRRENPSEGESYLQAMDIRAEQVISTSIVKDIDSAIDWQLRRDERVREIMEQDPKGGKKTIKNMDAMMDRIIDGTSRRVALQRLSEILKDMDPPHKNLAQQKILELARERNKKK